MDEAQINYLVSDFPKHNGNRLYKTPPQVMTKGELSRLQDVPKRRLVASLLRGVVAASKSTEDTNGHR